MGPAGWDSLAAQAMMSSIGQSVIQQLVQQLGLPQGMINVAQQAFAATAGGGAADALKAFGNPSNTAELIGNFSRMFNLSPRQEGDLNRAAKHAERQMFNEAKALMEEQAGKMMADGKKRLSESESTSKKGNFLQRMAEALGRIADQKMDDMDLLSDKIASQIHEGASITEKLNKLDKKDEKGIQGASQDYTTNNHKLGSMNSMMQATAQELGILQNMISTVLNSVGEAQSNLARKS